MKVRDICEYGPKSKIKAGEGLKTGKYKFFTSSSVCNKYLDIAQFETPGIIMGTGGNATLHYCSDKFSVSTDCVVLFPKTNIDCKYLYYFFKKNLQILEEGFKGAGLKHTNKNYINNIVINKSPSLCEQSEIVKVLDKVQLVINKKEEQLEELDMLVKSRFVEMFGDPTTNPKGWIKKKLSDECDIVTGNTPSRQVSEYYGDYIEWIKSDNINTPSATITKATEYLSEAGLSVARSVEAGSILMTCIAGSIKCIGNVAITDRKVSFNQQINGIVPRKNNTWFIYEQFELSKPYIQSTINMSLKGILSKGQLSEIEFVFPPTDLQNEFGVFVQQVDKLKLAVQKSLDETQVLFDSLMQKYFE